jgi:uncharacterized membrane protein
MAADLMNTLRAAGADVQVAEKSTWVDGLKGVALIVVLVASWIFMMRRKTRPGRDTNPSNQPSPGAIG